MQRSTFCDVPQFQTQILESSSEFPAGRARGPTLVTPSPVSRQEHRTDPRSPQKSLRTCSACTEQFSHFYKWPAPSHEWRSLLPLPPNRWQCTLSLGQAPDIATKGNQSLREAEWNKIGCEVLELSPTSKTCCAQYCGSIRMVSNSVSSVQHSAMSVLLVHRMDAATLLLSACLKKWAQNHTVLKPTKHDAPRLQKNR